MKHFCKLVNVKLHILNEKLPCRLYRKYMHFPLCSIALVKNPKIKTKHQCHIVLDKVFAYKSICWAKEFVMEFVCVSGWTEKCWAAWIDASDIYKKIIANFHQKRAPPFDPYICQPLPQQLTPWLFFCPTDGVRCKYLV